MNDRSVKFEKQDWQLATVLLVALLLALGAHLLTLQTLEELEEAGKELMGVYDGTESLRSLDRHLIELVHAQTNYMESGEVILVGKGEDAVRDIEQDLGKIKSYFQNEMTSPYLKKLEDFVRQKIIYHRNIMGAVQQNQPVEEAKMQFLAEGEQLRDSILEMTDTIRHYHRQHMLNYLNRKNDLSNKLLMVSLGSVIFVFLIAVFSIYYLMRTARRRRELLNNLVEAKENAERAAFLKEQFVANMSHEIRTPLNAIIGFANLLNRTSLKENQPEFVHSIRTSSENLLSIINDILDFSKIEAGALRLEYISFNLSALLHSIENMFLYREKNSPVKFYLHIDDKLPDSLKGDPTRLTQILVNLLGNAFKFTEEGRIDLSVKRQADLEEDKLLVSFEVRDTGIGISAGKLENIFDRFAQAASDTTRKYGGAGLGLTITKQLVEVQGGSIRVESEEGKGATFTVVIPFGIAADAQNRGPRTDLSDALSESGTTSILLVEDNPMNQRVAELLLDGWGFSHEHAINGREALEMLSMKTYDLILMDIQMPEMDGYTTTQKIRLELDMNIPIIATTAHAFAGEREKCISYGMNDYISKPLNEPELLQLILKYIKPQDQSGKVTDKMDTQKSEADRVENTIHFDSAYVQEIAKGDTATIKEMASLFISQSEKELQALEKALSERNFGLAARAAHSMKSTVSYMGFGETLGRSLQNLELETKKDTPSGALLWEQFETIRGERNAAVRFLRSEYLS